MLKQGRWFRPRQWKLSPNNPVYLVHPCKETIYSCLAINRFRDTRHLALFQLGALGRDGQESGFHPNSANILFHFSSGWINGQQGPRPRTDGMKSPAVRTQHQVAKRDWGPDNRLAGPGACSVEDVDLIGRARGVYKFLRGAADKCLGTIGRTGCNAGVKYSV